MTKVGVVGFASDEVVVLRNLLYPYAVEFSKEPEMPQNWLSVGSPSRIHLGHSLGCLHSARSKTAVKAERVMQSSRHQYAPEDLFAEISGHVFSPLLLCSCS